MAQQGLDLGRREVGRTDSKTCYTAPRSSIASAPGRKSLGLGNTYRWCFRSNTP